MVKGRQRPAGASIAGIADMADDRQSGSGLGGSSLLVLLVAAASALYVGWRSPPLSSSRPAEPDYEISRTAGAQDIDARLWQDPFAAVDRCVADKRSAKLDPVAGHRRSDFHDWPNSLSEPTLFIGVALPGDPYPEAVETRRRLRYAVLSALHAAQYVPADERHLGYLWINQGPPKPETWFFVVGEPGAGGGRVEALPPGAADAKPSDLPAIVPFEQYKAADRQKRVVVLWLDEEVLAHRGTPMTGLAGLLCKLELRGDESFALVGPQDSSVLQSMVEDIGSNPFGSNCAGRVSPPLRGKLPIYNYEATAEDRLILERAGASKTNIEQRFAAGGVSYYRTISSDRDLATALRQELHRRHIDPCPKQTPDSSTPPVSLCDRILLLSEWDTAYGPDLPDSVAKAFDTDDSSFGGCRLSPGHCF